MFNIIPKRGDRGYKFDKTNALCVPDLLDWAWIVGIYEGEGSCSRMITKYNPYVLIAGIVQKDNWILNKARDLFGGGVSPRSYESTNGKGACFVWRLGGARARAFLLTLYPHLSPRRKQQIRNALRDSWLGLITVEP